MVEFNLEKMKLLVEEDALLKFMVKNLGNDDRAYKVIFNSEVLDDSVMEERYKSI